MYIFVCINKKKSLKYGIGIKKAKYLNDYIVGIFCVDLH